MPSRLLRLLTLLGVAALALAWASSGGSVYAAQLGLPGDSVARVGGTGPVLVSKYPVVLSDFTLLYQGGTASTLFDQVQFTLRVEDPAYAGYYNVYVLIYTDDPNDNNPPYAAAGTVSQVYIDTAGTTFTGTLPQAVSQEEVTAILVQVERAG